jgi:hypothetical protein
LPPVFRNHRLLSFVPVGLALVTALSAAGCSVLFVPRKPDATPSPTPNTAVHAFLDLEARLPDSINGTPTEKFSLVSDPELQTPKTLEVLRRLGSAPTDLQLAKATASGVDITIAAMRIVGADASRAALAFEQVDEGDPHSTSTYAAAVVAGKRVLVRTTGNVIAYLYPVGDVLFVVDGRRDFVEEALTKIN